MDIHSILSVTVSIKKIKGAARQRYVVHDAQCEQAFILAKMTQRLTYRTALLCVKRCGIFIFRRYV